MSEPELYHALLMLLFALSGVVFVALGLVSAPYGRHDRRGWGPGVPERLGWVVMEAPAPLLFVWVYFQGPRALEVVPLVMLTLWQVHYVHRSFVYPLMMRSRPGRRISVAVMLMAMVFNGLNAYLNARWLTAFGPAYGLGWLLSFRFLYGLLVFCTGFVINRWADAKLRSLRKPGQDGYAIPRGGLYDEISCPNYFGELLQWTGWAILTWSPAGLAFALFTAANLVPRAVTHHRWYQRTFPDYPRRRKAIIPYVL
jgi:protein-S-isoprenylcysteine O-methyltransferase Ste14